MEELPRVEVKDVPRHLEKQKFDIVNTKKGISLQTSEQITNEISYLKLILNINELNDDLARFIPLFCDCFSKMGTQSTDYSNLSRKIKSFTGGFNASSFSHSFFRLFFLIFYFLFFLLFIFYFIFTFNFIYLFIM